MRRTLATTAALVLTLAVAAGCGDDGGGNGGDASSSGAGSSASSSADAGDSEGGSEGGSQSGEDAKVIEITFDGDSVTPNGERVEVAAGQPVELDVTADAPGEIHVHSSPEQELEYAAGTSTLELQPLEQPGIVEVESHSLEKTIVQLEVR